MCVCVCSLLNSHVDSIFPKDPAILTATHRSQIYTHLKVIILFCFKYQLKYILLIDHQRVCNILTISETAIEVITLYTD